MTYLLTGSTGFIGNELAKALIAGGDKLHLLVRSPEKALSLGNQNITLFKGDVTDAGSIEKAIKGCEGVFHLAAVAKVWSSHPENSFRVNVEGTKNILEAAERNGIAKVVFTSSAGTLRPTGADELADEESDPPAAYLTEYERSKAQAEEVCNDFVKRGLHVVIVNPSRVYGPGFLGESNSVTKILSLYDRGKWHILPGDGSSWGNYVFIGDVVTGHLLAMEKGVSGNRYILGGENVTFRQFFSDLAVACGKSNKLIPVPGSLMKGVAGALFVISRMAGKDPLITPAWAERYLQHRRLSVEKSMHDLGYTVTPFNEGLTKTLAWLHQQNHRQ